MPFDAVIFHLSIREPASCPAADAGDVQVCGRREPLLADNIIQIQVNGQAGKMLVDPGGPEIPACNPDFAIRAHFEGVGPIPLASVGPIDVDGGSGRVHFVSPGRHIEGQAIWSARPAVRGADCWMGPAALKVPVVTFRIAPIRPSATVTVFPFYRGSDSDGASDARLDIASYSIQVRFDGIRDPTALSASATLAVATLLEGSVVGPLEQSEIWFGVSRPIRRLRVRKPIIVGGLVLDRLYARVSDYGNARRVQSINSDELGADDVVVKGRKPHPGRARILRIGRSDLARCSEITFNFRAKNIQLTC